MKTKPGKLKSPTPPSDRGLPPAKRTAPKRPKVWPHEEQRELSVRDEITRARTAAGLPPAKPAKTKSQSIQFGINRLPTVEISVPNTPSAGSAARTAKALVQLAELHREATRAGDDSDVPFKTAVRAVVEGLLPGFRATDVYDYEGDGGNGMYVDLMPPGNSVSLMLKLVVEL